MVESSKQVKLKEFIGNWYNNRNIYSFENRGDITKDTRNIFPYSIYLLNMWYIFYIPISFHLDCDWIIK